MPQLIPLADLTLDLSLQMRESMNPGDADEYAEDLKKGDVFPPIVAFDDGEKLWVADGFSRYKAHEKFGADKILTDLRQGTYRDAKLFACQANGSHGRRRTRDDRRKAVMSLITDSEWTEKADNWIAQQCRVSNHLVSDMRAELDYANGKKNGNLENSKSEGTIGQDGKRRKKPHRNWFTMCKRCSRMGKPCCPKCLERAKTQKPVVSGQNPERPGTVLINWSEHENHFGMMVRRLDRIAEHYPETRDRVRGLHRLLSEFKASFDSVKKDAQKASKANA